jgi:hypothetical protein
MKNIFDYLITGTGRLNEGVFESFSHWMFEGSDATNKLSRIFLRWSVLYIIQNAGTQKPDNESFYSFFQGFDRTDFDSFLNHITKDGAIAVLVEQTLGDEQTTEFPGDNQATYWYFFGKISEHIEQKNLFPNQPETKSNALKFGSDKKDIAQTPPTDDPLSDNDQKSLSSVFALIFVALVVAFLFFNLFLK